jgi:hypothetical protein
MKRIAQTVAGLDVSKRGVDVCVISDGAVSTKGYVCLAALGPRPTAWMHE